MIETFIPPTVDFISPEVEPAAPVMELVEVPAPEVHPLMTTNFADYSVTEGLLLLIFLSLGLGLLLKVVGEVF